MRELTKKEFEYYSSYFSSKSLKNTHIYFKTIDNELKMVCNANEIKDAAMFYNIFDRKVNETPDDDIFVYLDEEQISKKHIFIRYKKELFYYLLTTSAYEGKNYIFMDVKITPYIE